MGEDTTVDSDTDMVLDTTDMDTDISARGPLMPNPRPLLNPRLMPLLMLTTDTMAVDTVMDTDSDMAVTTVDTTDTPMLVTDTVTSARDPLMPNLRLMLLPLLMLTTDTMDMDTVMAVTMVDTMDTPMPVDTVMAVSVTTVRFN